MNKTIMELAISQVKRLVVPIDGKCEICHRNEAQFSTDEIIEIKGIPTEVGLSTCRSCFDNIQIAAGEISEEY